MSKNRKDHGPEPTRDLPDPNYTPTAQEFAVRSDLIDFKITLVNSLGLEELDDGTGRLKLKPNIGFMTVRDPQIGDEKIEISTAIKAFEAEGLITVDENTGLISLDTNKINEVTTNASEHPQTTLIRILTKHKALSKIKI